MIDLGDGGSVRSDGDSWAITESVGATALAVAAFRAVATGATDPLIQDPFARLLVSPAGSAWARLASPDLEWIDDDEQGRRAHQLFCDYRAVPKLRTGSSR
jgi:O-methyltransferase involved in polyketide biosynthesis